MADSRATGRSCDVHERLSMLNDRLRFGLVILVGAGWVFNLVVPAFVDSYDQNLAANGPLLLILGAMFTKRKSDSGKSDDTNGGSE